MKDEVEFVSAALWLRLGALIYRKQSPSIDASGYPGGAREGHAPALVQAFLLLLTLPHRLQFPWKWNLSALSRWDPWCTPSNTSQHVAGLGAQHAVLLKAAEIHPREVIKSCLCRGFWGVASVGETAYWKVLLCCYSLKILRVWFVLMLVTRGSSLGC